MVDSDRIYQKVKQKSDKKKNKNRKKQRRDRTKSGICIRDDVQSNKHS